MSRIPSTDLFDLIKSMTKAEKRLFKLYAARHTIGERNKYEVLFDAIDKQRRYDEEGLLRGVSSLHDVDLTSMKSHLYDLILRSLRSLQPPRTSVAGVQAQIDKAIILVRKGLYPQAARLLAKVKKVARENDHLIKYLDIVFLESELKIRQQQTNSLERHHELHEQILETLDKLRENTQHYDLFMQMHYLQLSTGNLSGSTAKEQLDRLMENPLLREGATQSTFYAAMQYYEVHLRAAQTYSDVEKSFDYVCRKLDLFDAYPQKRKSRLYEYIYACGFYLVQCVRLGKYREFRERMEILKSFEDISGPLQADLYVNIAYSQFAYHVGRCRFERAAAMIPQINEFLQREKGKVDLSTVLTFYAGFAFLHMRTGETRTMLAWTGRILNHPGIASHQAFEETARLLTLIGYAELEDDRALESGIRSMYRYLIRKGWLGEFQKRLLRFLRTLPAIPNRSGLVEAFTLFRDELLELEQTEGKGALPSQVHILLWLQSKIEGRPFAVLLREREERRERERMKEMQEELEEL